MYTMTRYILSRSLVDVAYYNLPKFERVWTRNWNRLEFLHFVWKWFYAYYFLNSSVRFAFEFPDYEKMACLSISKIHEFKIVLPTLQIIILLRNHIDSSKTCSFWNFNIRIMGNLLKLINIYQVVQQVSYPFWGSF